jgi:Zn finger protein HypA/HybF involved in hydrogenase expression
MHELSVALEVCRMAEERLGPVGAGTLTSLAVVVGDDAGVEPGNLSFWLETLLTEPPFRGAHAVIERRAGAELRLAYLEVDDARPHDRGP